MVTRLKTYFYTSFDRLTGHVGDQGSPALFKVKGCMGQGQPKGHDIARWAHVNAMLHFLVIYFTGSK